MTHQSHYWHISREKHNCKRYTHPNVYCSTFMIARTWKQPKCPLAEEWIKKMWYICTHTHTMDYYSSIKRNKIVPVSWFLPLWSSLSSKVSLTWRCLTLCDPIDYSPSGCSVHGISQARILEWVAISLSWGSSRPRDWTWLSCYLCRFFTNWAIRKAPNVGIAACYLVCADKWLSFSTHLYKGSWFPEYAWFPKRRIFFWKCEDGRDQWNSSCPLVIKQYLMLYSI